MKLAVSTMPWGRLGSAGDLEKILDFLSSLGVEGVGIEYNLLPAEIKKRPERLAKLLEASGLENAGAYSRASSRDLEWASASGTPLLWIVVRERRCGRAFESLRSFARESLRRGVAPALHNHLRTCFESQASIEEALDRIEGLGLCLDTAHAQAAGYDLEALLERHGGRLSLVHVKDLRGGVPRSRVRFRRDFLNIGRGSVDFKRILGLLSRAGYRGYLMLEIEALENLGPWESVAQGVGILRGLLAQG